MRISDWSSDVCSSDLACHVGARRRFLSRRHAVERLGDADAAARRSHAMIEAIQAWAARYAADRRYSPVGQGFHWTMAALILFQLFWGRHMKIGRASGRERVCQYV